MSEVFVSYKREDETRVGRLVQALESTGLSVWWDRGLAGGESWRAQIQAALDAAKCLIVVWTHESVGPAGDFVRDEAGQAKRRGVLVPVKLDTVDPPLGFGEIQAIDLTHWKGNLRDPFFQDLCAAVTAKLEGRPVPPAKGPMKRLVRRLTLSSVASAIGFGALAFGFNLFSAQDQVCGISFLQPQLSDVCGAFGLGNRPTKTERIAWEGREPGSCAALRAHVEHFPQGAYRHDAADILAARRVTQMEIWTPSTRRLALFVGEDDALSSDEAAGRAAALSRGQVSAERLCKGFAAATSFRFTSATAAVQTWRCAPAAKGVVCGFEGEAVCAVEERHMQEIEVCGG
jgi:TIR domain